MASALAQQLQGIRKEQLSGKGRASFIFTASEAAGLDADTIFSLAHNGFLSLCQIDNRFEPFESTLFSESSVQLDRDGMTKEEATKVNESVRSFLRLLSPYFLLKASHKALEHLVRKFKYAWFVCASNQFDLFS